MISASSHNIKQFSPDELRRLQLPEFPVPGIAEPASLETVRQKKKKAALDFTGGEKKSSKIFIFQKVVKILWIQQLQ